MAGVELGHVDGRGSFESILVKYRLQDPALRLLGRIVHGADIPADLGSSPPEAHGLRAIAYGFAVARGERPREDPSRRVDVRRALRLVSRAGDEQGT